MKIYIGITSLLCLLASSASAQIIDNRNVQPDIWQNRALIINRTITLPTEEKIEFMDIFAEYNKKLTMLNTEKTELISEYFDFYGKMTPKKANEIMERLFKIKENTLSLNKEYYRKVKKEFDTIIAARFIQAMNIIINQHDLKFAARIPLFK